MYKRLYQKYIIILIILFIALCFSLCNAGTTDDILQQLNNIKQKDSVFYLNDSLIDGKNFLRRAIIINQSKEIVWNNLIDITEVKKIIPKLKRYNIVETFPDSLILFCAAKPRWYLKTYSCTVSVIHEPLRKIKWVRTGGDFKAMECMWDLYSIAPDQTLAIYSLHFKLGGLIPGFLIKWGVKKGLTDIMIDVREWISVSDYPDD